MALSAERIDRIPRELLKNGLIRLSSSSVPSFFEEEADRGGGELEQDLHLGRLVQGGVVELSVAGGAALGTSLALHACRYAQEQSRERYGQSVWCAFVDPEQTLFAPGVAALGIDMSRLLVVRPDEKSLSRVALRLVEAQVFPVVVIDTMGVPGAGVDVSLARWVPAVRRLVRAVEGTQSTVVLLTDQTAKRPLPLPVTQRFELSRRSVQQLLLRVTRSSGGTCSSAGAGTYLRRATSEVEWSGGPSLRSCRLSAQQLLLHPARTIFDSGERKPARRA